MRVHLRYKESSHLRPVHMARLLCDIEGVVFAGVTIYDAAFEGSQISNILYGLNYSELINIEAFGRQKKTVALLL